jgi:hypothetical protein
MNTVTISRQEYEGLLAAQKRYEFVRDIVRKDNSSPLPDGRHGHVMAQLRVTKDKDDDLTPRQRRIIDRRLAMAEDDVKTGRVSGPFNTIKELTAHLNSR